MSETPNNPKSSSLPLSESWTARLIIYLVTEGKNAISIEDLISLLSSEELEMIEQDELLQRLKICTTSWNAMYKDCKDKMPKRYKYVDGNKTKYRYKKVDILAWLETRVD